MIRQRKRARLFQAERIRQNKRDVSLFRFLTFLLLPFLILKLKSFNTQNTVEYMYEKYLFSIPFYHCK